MAIVYKCPICKKAWVPVGKGKCSKCGQSASKGSEKHYYVVLKASGKQIWRRAGTSLKAARLLESELKRQLALGEVVPQKDDKILFKDFWDKYYFPWVETNNDPSWTRRKANIYSLHLAPFFGKRRLKDITKRLVERYVQKRLSEEVIGRPGRKTSPAEVNREVAVLKHALSKAVEWDFIKSNPLSRFKMLKEDIKTREPRPLTVEEAQRLIANMRPEIARIVIFALLTGLRLGNVLRAKWEWIDFERRVIRIPASEMKTSKDHVIPMNEALINFLSTLPRLPNTPYLFPNSKGEPYKDIRGSFKGAAKRAGLEGLTFHDLRHTFGVWALSQGIHIGVLKQLMGHSTITTTQKYLKLHDELLAKEAKKLEKLGNIILLSPYQHIISS